MTGAHFDPAHPDFAAHANRERQFLVLILFALLVALPCGIALALWKRARGEGWHLTPLRGVFQP